MKLNEIIKLANDFFDKIEDMDEDYLDEEALVERAESKLKAKVNKKFEEALQNSLIWPYVYERNLNGESDGFVFEVVVGLEPEERYGVTPPSKLSADEFSKYTTDFWFKLVKELPNVRVLTPEESTEFGGDVWHIRGLIPRYNLHRYI